MAANVTLTQLHMRDVVELYRARVNLHQTYAAIEQTSLQAKPALLGSLDQADDAILVIIKKCAKRAVRFGAAGEFKRVAIPDALMQLLVELAPPPPEPEPKPPPSPTARRRRTPSVNGNDQEVK